MRKLMVVAILLGVLACATKAFALPTLAPYSLNIFDDRGFENFFDADSSGTITKGDVFNGILLIEQIDEVLGTPHLWDWNPGVEELTGAFNLVVDTVTPDGGNPNLGTITYDTALSTTAFYFGTGATADWSNSAPTIAQATNGALYLTASIDYWQGTGPINLAYWLANPSLTAGFLGGLEIQVNNTGYGFDPIAPGIGLPDGGPLQPVDLYTKGSGVGFAPPSTGWQFYFQDINTYGRPVPEPGSMLLLGMGLAGLAAIRRKKAA